MLPGEQIAERFELEQLAQVGGMGAVFRARDRISGERVAIKLLRAPGGSHDDRFLREAALLAELRHPAIVRHVAHGRTPQGELYLAMEWLEGEDLASRLQRGALPAAEAIALVRRAADGLALLHARGGLHRDLKPANLFLARRDDGSLLVKILDFGVSKVRDNATAITREVAILGTPDFMSPEQAVGLTDAVDERSDVFAVGGIIYLAVTGRPPFDAASVPAQLRRICDEEPVPVAELRPDAPPGLAAVIAIALAKRPEERYAGPGELAADLSLVIAGGDVGAIVARAARVQRGKPASRSVVDGVRRDDSVAMARTHGG